MFLDPRSPQHHVGLDVVVIEGPCRMGEDRTVRRQAQRVEMDYIEIYRRIPVDSHPPGNV
jgi:hypothetical protein